MDHAAALNELREEIKQIISNYEESLRRTRGGIQSGKIRNHEMSNHLTLVAEYAILIYGMALREVDLRIMQLSKI